ncbi:SANT/Myb_domain [Hexamita inflata]|uniref:SANT/Myb domain n=1 Tax=Hexamita inflata TaxID=28002 RepID=A0AA86U6X7_9EUKA|nr:SANT/Myb domain [Hexamita inflata]CAI9943423.1 SANT/Myb domain [Hexamita inflata]CAI9943428.1 SANT/Myb domain [Hexamita inflata]
MTNTAKLLTNTLTENFVILQEIHVSFHAIHILQLNNEAAKNDRWTQEEDVLLDCAYRQFGATNYIALSLIVSSKSPAQVYQRLRYLRERAQSKVLNK